MQGHTCFIIFFLLQCVFNVLGEICPRPEDINPCICTHQVNEIDVVCKSANFRKVQKAFRSLKGKTVRNINFEKLIIGWLPSTFFFGMDVQNLYIKDCRLTGLSDAANKPALVGLGNSLEKLSINNSLKGRDRLTSNIAHLAKLVEIDLSYNNMPELDNSLFKDGPLNLEKVTIHKSGTKNLGDRVFEKLTKLKELKISSSPFKTFRRTMLPNPAADLVSLYLDDVGLFSLPVDAFEEMPNLKDVSLERNSITRLPSDTWEKAWENLEIVNLIGNLLECDVHIDWTIKDPPKRPAYLDAICSSPDSRKNLKLQYVIDKKIPVSPAIEITEEVTTTTVEEATTTTVQDETTTTVEEIL